MKKISLGFFVVFITVFYSCSSGELTRGKAEKLINEKFGFPLAEFTTYNQQGVFSSRKTLEKEGALKVINYTEKSFSGRRYAKEKVEITGLGKKYIFKGQSDHFGKNSTKLATNTIEVKEITGIKTDENNLNATVELILIRKNITPWGVGYKYYKENQEIQKNIQFEKYDDGWRITSPSNIPYTTSLSNVPILLPDNRAKLEKEQEQINSLRSILSLEKENHLCIIKSFEKKGDVQLVTVDFVQREWGEDEMDGWEIKNVNPKLRTYIIDSNTRFGPGGYVESLEKAKKVFKDSKNSTWMISAEDGYVSTLAADTAG